MLLNLKGEFVLRKEKRLFCVCRTRKRQTVRSAMDTPHPLLAEWRRLILPPAGLPLTGGEQLDHGNHYPNAPTVDLEAHLAGHQTYAVDLAYTLDGQRWTKCGVLDIDEGEASPTKADLLRQLAEAQGITAALAWSGRKGCHVWLFSEPVEVATMCVALKKLKLAVPHKGELAPLDVQRVKLPPAWHRVGRAWAAFYRPGDTIPRLTDQTPPTGFLDRQAAILGELRPTPANVLAAYALSGQEVKQTTDPEATRPHLERLGGKLAPCIAALLERGPSPGQGSYDKNNLSLARYCHAAGLPQEEADSLAYRLADNPTPEGFTTKDRHAKLRHWDSLQNTPAVAEGFNCLYLVADKTLNLRFNCGKCAARPAGLKRGGGPKRVVESFEERLSKQFAQFSEMDRELARLSEMPAATPPPEARERLKLEPLLVEQLLAHTLAGGQPPDIHPRIFSVEKYQPNDSDTFHVPLAGLLWEAVGEACLTPAAVASWLEGLPHARLAPGKDAARKLVRSSRLAGELRQWATEQLITLVDSLRRRPALSEHEAADVVARARALSAKAALTEALDAAAVDVQIPGRGVLEVIDGLHQATAGIQKGQADFGAPLETQAVELLEGLVETHRPAIATPFDTLNAILGGGLQAGKLYVLAAPPGAGKTTLACQLADYAAASGVPVAYVALEMGRGQLFDYALARAAGVNSARIEARQFRRSEADTHRLAAAAQDYLARVGPNLAIIEGDYYTTPAKLAAWVTGARARYKLTPQAPVLLVVDYLQLLNTGLEELDSQQNETPRISQVAVQLKQLARQTGAAVLALSDINRAEQNSVTKANQEFTLSAFRGSNRIGHAADVALVLYSESATGDGGKAASGPWDLLGEKLKGNPRAVEFLRSLETAKIEHQTGGPGAAVYARLELLKNRGGQGRGNQLLVYEKAFHRFQPVACSGQDAAEGRA